MTQKMQRTQRRPDFDSIRGYLLSRWSESTIPQELLVPLGAGGVGLDGLSLLCTVFFSVGFTAHERLKTMPQSPVCSHLLRSTPSAALSMIAAVELRMVASLLKLPTPHLDVIALSVFLQAVQWEAESKSIMWQWQEELAARCRENIKHPSCRLQFLSLSLTSFNPGPTRCFLGFNQYEKSGS